MLIARLFITAAIVIAAVAASRAYAVPPTELQKKATWELPTTRTDGSLLDITEIAETRIYCGIDDAALIQVATVAVPGTDASLALPLDTKVCAATVVDIDGLESSYSNLVSIKGQPNPPGNLLILTITIATQ